MAEDKKLNPEELENVAGGFMSEITCPNCGNSFYWKFDPYGRTKDPYAPMHKCNSCGHEW